MPRQTKADKDRAKAAELLGMTLREYLEAEFVGATLDLEVARRKESTQAARDMRKLRLLLRKQIDELPAESKAKTADELIEDWLADVAAMPQSLQQRVLDGVQRIVRKGRLRVVE